MLYINKKQVNKKSTTTDFLGNKKNKENRANFVFKHLKYCNANIRIPLSERIKGGDSPGIERVTNRR